MSTNCLLDDTGCEVPYTPTPLLAAALPAAALPPAALLAAALPTFPPPPSGSMLRYCHRISNYKRPEDLSPDAYCRCGECKPQSEPVKEFFTFSHSDDGNLRSMTSGIGICRTLSGLEQEYEANKAATAKRKNPYFRVPRYEWWWSDRVEELYKKDLATNSLERTGACTPQCSCEMSGRPCGDRQESEEEPDFVPGKRTDSVIGLTNQGGLVHMSNKRKQD